MPSPFPGMDPYLEGHKWRSFHAQLSSEIARFLSPLVRPKYLVRAEKIYVSSGVAEDVEDYQIPDVAVVTESPDWRASSRSAVVEAPLQVVIPLPKPEPQITVEIRDVEDQTLVTAIEVLSISNKRGHGRKKYLSKRNRLLKSKTHLMEIDLLRSGHRMPFGEPLPEEPYFIMLSRANDRPIAGVWPISLRSHLPTVPIPLMGGDKDVMLNMQQVFSTLYDIYSYEFELHYDGPPQITLSPDDALWAADLIRNRTR